MLKKEERQYFLVFFILLYLVILIRNTWVSDDAYISFRVIENFVAGYGPNFNPYVRVQAYTHPLWMFLISGLYFIQVKLLHINKNDGLYFLVITVSILISTGAFTIALYKLSKDSFYEKILLSVALLSSTAFIDFSTSGLENPLTYLLLTLFLIGFFKKEKNLFALSLYGSLLATNRLDTILLVFPALLLAFWTGKEKTTDKLRSLILGFSPFILWETFSLLYYGFPFPNTAYAKLNTGIARISLLTQGIDYFLNSLAHDPVTLLLIMFTGIVIFIQKEKEKLSVYLGVFLYLLYILYIGGDFMMGRFFAAPFFVAIILLSTTSLFSEKVYFVVIASTLLLTVYSESSPFKSLSDKNITDKIILANADEDWIVTNLIGKNGIANEKYFYFFRSGLTEQGVRLSEYGSPYAGNNWKFTGFQEFSVEVALGWVSYQRGPNAYMIDHFALSDPLLARLPVKDKVSWRIGHFWRAKPAGYADSLKSGTNLIEDPYLAEYYEKLKVVIEGPIWEKERLLDIWKFNTGQYDYLLDGYLRNSQ